MSSSVPTHDRHEFWQEHVNACSSSGLSKARYCRENNLTYHLFIYWASKISADVSTDNQVSSPGASKLVPVVLSESDVAVGLQLHLPNGVLISGICAQTVGMVGALIEQL